MPFIKRFFSAFKFIKKSEPADERIRRWLLQFYDENIRLISETDTNSAYFLIQLPGYKKIKIRISNHLQIFNNCNIYIQKVYNDDNHVIVMMKNRQILVLNYHDAKVFIQDAVQKMLIRVDGQSVKTENTENVSINKSFKAADSLPTTLNTKRLKALRSCYCDFNMDTFADFMKSFEIHCGNINYKRLNKETQDNLMNLFKTSHLTMKQLYEIFAYVYNRNANISDTVKRAIDISEFCKNDLLAKYKHLNGYTIAADIEIELQFKTMPFFNGLIVYDKKFNNYQYRTHNIKRCREMMAGMFPWISLLHRDFLMSFDNLFNTTVSLKRIIEALLIAHNRYLNSSLSIMLNAAFDILRNPAWNNVH